MGVNPQTSAAFKGNLLHIGPFEIFGRDVLLCAHLRDHKWLVRPFDEIFNISLSKEIGDALYVLPFD